MAKWLIVACVLMASCSKEKAASVEAFGKTWSNGHTERYTYDLRKPVPGTAIATFVSETFSNSLRVKSDPNMRDKKDEFSAMRLSLVEGHRMLQSVVALDGINGRPPGVVTKVIWSSQEQNGARFKEALLDRDVLRVVSHSYLDGEADQSLSEATPAPGVLSEDALMLWARGMAWPLLKAEELREVSILFALQNSRFKESPGTWGLAALSRTSLETVDLYKAHLSNGRQYQFQVEKTAPYRILKYTTSEGVEAVLQP